MTEVKKTVVEFRTNSQYAADIIGNTIQYVWRDGTIWTFQLGPCSQANKDRAAMYGFQVAIARAGAVEQEKFPGTAERLAEQKRRMKAKLDHFVSGAQDWDLPRAAAKPKEFDSGIVVQAMIRALVGMNTPEQVEAILTKQITLGKFPDRESALKEWAKTKQVAEVIVIIEGERAAANSRSDAVAMLAELMGDEAITGLPDLPR